MGLPDFFPWKQKVKVFVNWHLLPLVGPHQLTTDVEGWDGREWKICKQLPVFAFRHTCLGSLFWYWFRFASISPVRWRLAGVNLELVFGREDFNFSFWYWSSKIVPCFLPFHECDQAVKRNITQTLYWNVLKLIPDVFQQFIYIYIYIYIYLE